MKSSKLFIFHFRPLENYPPIQNFLYLLNEVSIGGICISTKGYLERVNYSKNIKVKRFGASSKGKFGLWWSYLFYNFASLSLLILHRPSQVMYFETLSGFPAFVYVKYINPKAKLYIHYHEYTSPAEYDNVSLVERFFHFLEKIIYRKATWLSHTNIVRLTKFLKDEQILFKKEQHHFLPNYPLKKWASKNKKWNRNEVLRFIYVGYSLTAEGSYLSEIVEYLNQLEIQTKLSIYCLKPNDFIKQLEKKSQGNLTIQIYDGLAYDQLPKVLSQQHIGLILYRATTPNYINNAPNKLFEYLSCGLDVWYPQEMLGIHEYKTDEDPKVVCLNFKKLKVVDVNDLLVKKNKSRAISYYSEHANAELLANLSDFS
jgi:hypothetical protein